MTFSNCLVCGRLLTDPKSVDLGIGPICLNHLKRRRFREVRGLMNHYELGGWNYTKSCLARQGVDIDRLLEGVERTRDGEAISDV